MYRPGFPVTDVRDDGQAELEAGKVMGVPAVMHSTCAEPECLEAVQQAG